MSKPTFKPVTPKVPWTDEMRHERIKKVMESIATMQKEVASIDKKMNLLKDRRKALGRKSGRQQTYLKQLRAQLAESGWEQL